MFCQKFRKYHCLFIVINFATKDSFFLTVKEKMDLIFPQHGYSEYTPKFPHSSLKANVTEMLETVRITFLPGFEHYSQFQFTVFFLNNKVRKFHLIHSDMQFTNLRSAIPMHVIVTFTYSTSSIKKFRISLLPCKIYYFQELVFLLRLK